MPKSVTLGRTKAFGKLNPGYCVKVMNKKRKKLFWLFFWLLFWLFVRLKHKVRVVVIPEYLLAVDRRKLLACI